MNRSAHITVTAHHAASVTKECSCPCPDDHICDLECSTRPVFYCGQLLTDQDLNAFVHWMQQKQSLNRFRDGWGIVNGLQVHCDPERSGWVTVEPGYAISCCGEDILVCTPSGLNLNGACRAESDPCGDVRGGRKNPREADPKATEKEQTSRVAVDIFINYKENLSDAQTVLGRNGCGEASSCEYSRAQEVYELSWQPAMTGSDPVRAAAAHWLRQYKACLNLLDDFITEAGSFDTLTGHGAAIRNLIVDKLSRNPLHQFCHLFDKICALSDSAFEDESTLAGIMFYLVQDQRNHFLACRPQACQDTHGVPLGRAYLEIVEDEKGRRSCKVNSVDPYPPYRRTLQLDCWPAYAGTVNLGQVIWHRPEDACRILSREGLCIERIEEFTIPGTLEELRKALDVPIMTGYSAGKHMACSGQLVMQYLNTDITVEGGPRVVGFYEEYGDTPAPPSEQPKDVRLSLDGPRFITLDQSFKYNYRVENRGRNPLEAVTIHNKFPEGIGFVDISDVMRDFIRVENDGREIFIKLDQLGAGDVLEWDIEVKVASGNISNPFENSFEVLLQDGSRFTSDVVKTTFDVEGGLAGRITRLSERHERALHAAGIHTYFDLAGASPETLRKAVGNVSREQLDAWIREAKELAERGTNP